MGDGTDVVVVNSHGEETNKFPEDEQVAKNELVGSDKTRDDNEDEVFEEAIDSEIDEKEGPESDNDGLQENLPLEETLQSSKDEHELEDYEEAVGNLDEISKIEGGVKTLMPDNSIVGEGHGEVNAEDSEFDFVTPRMNGGKEEAENSLGQIESSLDVVEKADSNGPISDAEDVNIENGKTHSSLKNEIVFPEKNKELVAEVITESHGSAEPLDDGIEAKNWEEIVDGIRTEQVPAEGEGTTNNLFEKRTGQEVEVGEREFKDSFQNRSVCIENGSEAKINCKTGADCTRSFVNNASGVKPVNDSVGVVSVETVSPFEKSSSEEKGETEGDRNCLKPEHDLAYSLNPNIESTKIRNNSGSPGVTCREQETDQNANGQRDVQQSPQPSKEHEKQPNSSVIIDQGIEENSHVDRESNVVTSGSPTESRSNPAALPRPTGLGRAAPLLEPATRVPQKSRVNGNVSHNQNSHVDRESDVVTSGSPTESRSNPAALPGPVGLGRAAPLLEPATRVPQQSRVNGNVSLNQNSHVDRESDVATSGSPTESRSNPAALPRPAGLGRAAPLLEPATRVPQQSRVNGNVSHNQNSHVDRESDVATSGSPTESRSNPAALPRPAGLGRAAPLLEPATRVPQQSRVNGNVSHNQPQQADDSTIAETDEHDETREKLQLIRVKFLRLAHRLGQTPHNVVVAEVLYRLGLAEQLRGRSGSRVGAFSFDRASAMAEQLEAAGQDRLDFSCTIMVLGKSGVGKSATINSIFDEMKLSTDAFQSRTKRVQDVEGFVQGIKVRVIDTPGLLPSWSDQAKNEKILKSVKAFIKKNPPDIVLYIDRLDMQSRDSGDMPLLRTISDVFGPSIWFNAIVGLTHAASVPPDGPNGTASNYEMFITQRSQVIQQAIRQAAGDMRFMNPISLIENHSACRTNRAGQRVLPNGQVWKPHLLLLSFASKILAEANALLKLQDNIPGRPFAARSKAPPLPFLLSSFLQSRPQPKLPEQQYGDDDEDDLNELSDSDEESEYDQLPPFKRLTKAQMAMLSRPQKKQYLDEMEYREKLFMKKQMKEERKRRKMFKKFAAEIKDFPDGNSENLEDESGGPASVPVPMPDLPLPASFDSDNPTHRYRYLDSSNKWLVRPVLETHGWDHDTGYEGVNAERLFVVKEKIPISFSGQVTKDKKDANVQLEMASSVKHGECKSTSLGFDMQTVGKELAYTLRSETRFNNFRKNKAAAGLSVTLLGDSVSAGLKVEDKLIANKWFRMVMSGGAMTSRGDVAYGGSLEAQLRDKDYPLGRFLTTLGLSVMDWHGDLAIGGNIQSQVPIGRSSNLIARANLNNRGTGQVSVRVNSSEQLQLALVALVPLFKKLLYSPQTQY